MTVGPFGKYARPEYERRFLLSAVPDGTGTSRRILDRYETAPDMAAFVAPSWFGREVTADDRYSGAGLAGGQVGA